MQNKISKKWHKVTEQRQEKKQRGGKEVCAHFMCGETKERQRGKEINTIQTCNKRLRIFLNVPGQNNCFIIKLHFFKFSTYKKWIALCCIAGNNNYYNSSSHNFKNIKARKAITSLNEQEKNKTTKNIKIYISTTEVIGSTLYSAAFIMCSWALHALEWYRLLYQNFGLDISVLCLGSFINPV